MHTSSVLCGSVWNNPQINFCNFSAFWTCHFFFHTCLQQKSGGVLCYTVGVSFHPSVHPSPPKCIDSGYLVCTTPIVLLTKLWLLIEIIFCEWTDIIWSILYADVLCWGLTSQSTIFQSCRDGATASWVINQYFRGVKCLAQGHNTAAVGFEPPTSRSGVRHTTTEPPHSPYADVDLNCQSIELM